jgi:hypothetical protein
VVASVSLAVHGGVERGAPARDPLDRVDEVADVRDQSFSRYPTFLVEPASSSAAYPSSTYWENTRTATSGCSRLTCAALRAYTL